MISDYTKADIMKRDSVELNLLYIEILTLSQYLYYKKFKQQRKGNEMVIDLSFWSLFIICLTTIIITFIKTK